MQIYVVRDVNEVEVQIHPVEPELSITGGFSILGTLDDGGEYAAVSVSIETFEKMTGLKPEPGEILVVEVPAGDWRVRTPGATRAWVTEDIIASEPFGIVNLHAVLPVQRPVSSPTRLLWATPPDETIGFVCAGFFEQLAGCRPDARRGEILRIHVPSHREWRIPETIDIDQTSGDTIAKVTA